MRGFSKAGKICLAILLVLAIASVGLLISSLTSGKSPAIAIVCLVISLGGFAMTYRTAVNERKAKETEDEVNNIEDEAEDDSISEY